MGSAFLHLCCASVWAVCRWQRTAACLPPFSALWTDHHAGGTGHCRTGLSACKASRPWSWRLMSAPARCDRYAEMMPPYMPARLPAAGAGDYATYAAGFSWFSLFHLASHTLRSGSRPLVKPLVESSSRQGRAAEILRPFPGQKVSRLSCYPCPARAATRLSRTASAYSLPIFSPLMVKRSSRA